MSEQQADYDFDDTEPTPGTWRTWQVGEAPLINEECVLAEVADKEQPLVVASLNRTANENTDFPGHWKANARLIAAAGTAASEIQEDLNVIDLFRELPKIIRAADRAVDSTRFRDEDGRAHPPDRSHMVYLRNALNAVRKDTTQTDE
jgi:hypothetical protein